MSLRVRLTNEVDGVSAEEIECAERVYAQVELLIPKIKIERTAAAMGSRVHINMHIRGAGSAFKVYGHHDASIVLMNIVRNVASSKKYTYLKGELKYNLLTVILDVIESEIYRTHGTALQAMIVNTKTDAVSLKKAHDQVFKNRARFDDTKRTFAMGRLTDLMRGYEYSENDVLEAWRDSQVARVIES